jgi:hypothetical protein
VKEYLHREVSITLSTCLAKPDIEISRELNIGDNENIIARLTEMAAQLRDEALPVLRALKIPTDTLDGDFPMVQVQIEYMEVEEIVSSFGVTSTETMAVDERVVPVHRAITAAMNAFRARLARFVESEES